MRRGLTWWIGWHVCLELRHQTFSADPAPYLVASPALRPGGLNPSLLAEHSLPVSCWPSDGRGNGYHYNPTRQLKTGTQGYRAINPETGSPYNPRGSFNLYALKRRNMSFARTGFRRLLARLRLEYKHEGDHYNLHREVPPEFWFEGGKLFKKEHQPHLVYSGTYTSKLVD
jgi:hypothetical protein